MMHPSSSSSSSSFFDSILKRLHQQSDQRFLQAFLLFNDATDVAAGPLPPPPADPIQYLFNLEFLLFRIDPLNDLSESCHVHLARKFDLLHKYLTLKIDYTTRLASMMQVECVQLFTPLLNLIVAVWWKTRQKKKQFYNEVSGDEEQEKNAVPFLATFNRWKESDKHKLDKYFASRSNGSTTINTNNILKQVITITTALVDRMSSLSSGECVCILNDLLIKLLYLCGSDEDLCVALLCQMEHIFGLLNPTSALLVSQSHLLSTIASTTTTADEQQKLPRRRLNSKFQAQLSCIIHFTLQLVKNPPNGYYKVRVCGLRLLTTIYRQVLQADCCGKQEEKEEKEKINTIIVMSSTICFCAYTLPGIASAIAILLGTGSSSSTSPPPLHYLVILEALKLLHLLLFAVFQDGQRFFKGDDNDDNDDDVDHGSKVEEKEEKVRLAEHGIDHLVRLTNGWFERTSSRLLPLLSDLTTRLVMHPKQQVKQQLLHTVTDLLLHTCAQFLVKYCHALLHVPLTYLGGDESDKQDSADLYQISTQFADQFNQRIEKLVMNGGCDNNVVDEKNVNEAILSYSLRDTLHSEFFTLIKQLPFMVRNVTYVRPRLSTSNIALLIPSERFYTEETVYASFRTLAGYLRLLGPNGVEQFIHLDQHKYHLFHMLINIIEIDYQTIYRQPDIADLDVDDNDDDENTSKVDNLFDVFQLDRGLLRFFSSSSSSFSSRSLLITYRRVIYNLATCINNNSVSFSNVFDHLLSLLKQSDLEPSVLLVINMLIFDLINIDHHNHRSTTTDSTSDEEFRIQLNSYLFELIQLLREQFDLTQLYTIVAEEKEERQRRVNKAITGGDSIWQDPLTNPDSQFQNRNLIASINDDDDNDVIDSANLKPMSLQSLYSITQSVTLAEEEKDKSNLIYQYPFEQSYHHQDKVEYLKRLTVCHQLRHCFTLQSFTLCYAILGTTDHRYRLEFYRTLFPHFMQSLGATSDGFALVGVTAKRMLQWLGLQWNKQNGQHHKSAVDMLPLMVLDNVDYLYNAYTVMLDVSVLHQPIAVPKNPFHHSSSTESSLSPSYGYLLSLDHCSLVTVQTSLQTIMRLLSRYTTRLKQKQKLDIKLNDDQLKSVHHQLEYFHKLMAQILTIIKWYSIRPTHSKTAAANLCRLLQVLLSYIELMETLYHYNDGDECHQVSQPVFSIPVYDRNDPEMELEKELVNDEEMIKSLEDYVKAVHYSKAQERSNFSFEDDVKADEEEKIETKSKIESAVDTDTESMKHNILQSPIMKSQIPAILHHCHLVLSDECVPIRLAVLQLASRCMRLLRRYELILEPYVHLLWPSLVAQFTFADHPVAIDCTYKCILLASELCGDFLRTRTIGEVLPHLVRFARTQLNTRCEYYHRNGGRLYELRTANYYAELELLRTVGKLVANIRVKTIEDLDPLVQVLMLYTTVRPVVGELREAAFHSLVIIGKSEGGGDGGLGESGLLKYYLHRIIQLYYHCGCIGQKLSNQKDSNDGEHQSTVVVPEDPLPCEKCQKQKATTKTTQKNDDHQYHYHRLLLPCNESLLSRLATFLREH